MKNYQNLGGKGIKFLPLSMKNNFTTNDNLFQDRTVRDRQII